MGLSVLYLLSNSVFQKKECVRSSIFDSVDPFVLRFIMMSVGSLNIDLNGNDYFQNLSLKAIFTSYGVRYSFRSF